MRSEKADRYFKSLQNRIVLHDLLNPENPDMVFDSQKEFAAYFGKTESWVSQRFRRGKTVYRGYEVERLEGDEIREADGD